MAGLVGVPGVGRGNGNENLKPVGRTASPFSRQECGALENGLNPYRFKVLHVSLTFTLGSIMARGLPGLADTCCPAVAALSRRALWIHGGWFLGGRALD